MSGNQTLEIACHVCNHKGKPTKWWPRMILGFFLLPIALVPGVLYFLLTNSYYCNNCGKRNKLSKIINEKEIPIKSLPKPLFISITVFLLLILIALVFVAYFTKNPVLPLVLQSLILEQIAPGVM